MPIQVPMNPATGEPYGMSVLVNPDTNTPFDMTNPLPVIQQTSSSAALTSVPAATVSTAILAANANRKGAYITNNGAANMYLAYGPTASLTAFTVKLVTGGFFALPTTPTWQGALSAIWDAALGNAQITEAS